MKIKCKCGHIDEYDKNDLINEHLVICHSCCIAIDILLLEEDYFYGASAVFEKGDLVTITNKEHAWRGQIGIVRDTKPGFCRIEIFGQLVWIHNNWIQTNETDGFN